MGVSKQHTVRFMYFRNLKIMPPAFNSFPFLDSKICQSISFYPTKNQCRNLMQKPHPTALCSLHIRINFHFCSGHAKMAQCSSLFYFSGFTKEWILHIFHLWWYIGFPHSLPSFIHYITHREIEWRLQMTLGCACYPTEKKTKPYGIYKYIHSAVEKRLRF